MIGFEKESDLNQNRLQCESGSCDAHSNLSLKVDWKRFNWSTVLCFAWCWDLMMLTKLFKLLLWDKQSVWLIDAFEFKGSFDDFVKIRKNNLHIYFFSSADLWP